MKIPFIKMHGCGNDYIFIKAFPDENFDYSHLAKMISKRHFSIGSDGLVVLYPSLVAEIKMRMFNADGSEGKLCGNALCCVSKNLVESGQTTRNEFDIETISGIKHVQCFLIDQQVERVSVQMGKAVLNPKGLINPSNITKENTIILNQKEFGFTTVSIGNPHVVIFVDHLNSLDLDKIGPQVENNPIFNERVNTEFVKIIDEKTIEMRVWERGSNETLACGTGACAAVVACVLHRQVDYDTPVTVIFNGGKLGIQVNRNLEINMTGTATKVYEGIYDYAD